VNEKGASSIAIPFGEVAEWYRSLPEGGLTRCYHCGEEGRLTGPPFSGLCVDREGCYTRQLLKRMDLWELEGSSMATCTHCGELGPVLRSEHHNGCVDSQACNRRRCDRNGHQPSVVEHRQCLTEDFAAAMENIGSNRWRLFRTCTLCDEILTSRTYSEA
jgi:hypothetical protein